MATAFLDRLKAGDVLVADGATGTNLQARGLAFGKAPEEWLFEQPEQIRQLHRDFVAAGANILLTCTFGGTPLRLEHVGMADKVVEVNRTAVALAREAIAGREVLIAGSLGPTGQLLEPLGPLSEADCAGAFAAQARALSEAGADLLVIETQFDLAEATNAIRGARSVTTRPLVVSFSYDMGQRTMMGLEPGQVARELASLGVDVVGVNCGKSLEDNLANLKAARAATTLPIWMKPNAGLPTMSGVSESHYDVTPDMMGAAAQQWVASGANICGGCCGTSPEHLRHIAQAAALERQA
ncbi:MAG: homocysteine S-methyltransferase family protein [Anaerolineales bacterium]|nr:homocysteine S-methyltransferase family protein [Anaerolineales bacterium]